MTHPMITDEQILELCQIAIVDDESRFEGYAGEFLTYYAIKISDKELSPEELRDKVAQLVFDGYTSFLTKEGFIDYNYETGGFIPTDKAMEEG